MEKANLVVDDPFGKTVSCCGFDQELDLALVFERREEVCGFVDRSSDYVLTPVRSVARAL